MTPKHKRILDRMDKIIAKRYKSNVKRQKAEAIKRWVLQQHTYEATCEIR